MVVCQYFQQGRCYFGQNCRNEHIYTNDGRGGRNSGNNQISNVIWQISNDVTAAEKGGQWPLTSFGPIKEGPCVPGWEDISPEEVRWALYESQKNGTVNQTLNQISQWYKNAEKARNLMKQPTPEVINLLNDILRGKKSSHQSLSTTSSIFPVSTSDPKTSFRFDKAVTNIFGKPASPVSTSVNIFGGGTASSGAGGPAGSSPSHSVFSQPQQQLSSQNIFGGSPGIFGGGASGSGAPVATATPFFPAPSQSQNVFQINQSFPTPNIFAGSTPSVFASSVAPPAFGQAPNAFGTVGTSEQSSPFQFQNAATSFGTAPDAVPTVDMSMYSKMEDLSESEVKAFRSTTFTFRNIPLKPPPQQYC